MCHLVARGIYIRWQHLIFFYAQQFSCIKKIGESWVCWAVGPALQSNSSNCLVLILHGQFGNLGSTVLLVYGKIGKLLIYIVPFHTFFIPSKVLYNCKYHPSLGHSLCHSFVRRSHLLPDQLPGEHTDHKAAISWLPYQCSDPIQNAHILPLAITARYQFYTLVM